MQIKHSANMVAMHALVLNMHMVQRSLSHCHRCAAFLITHCHIFSHNHRPRWSVATYTLIGMLGPEYTSHLLPHLEYNSFLPFVLYNNHSALVKPDAQWLHALVYMLKLPICPSAGTQLQHTLQTGALGPCVICSAVQRDLPSTNEQQRRYGKVSNCT